MGRKYGFGKYGRKSYDLQPSVEQPPWVPDTGIPVEIWNPAIEAPPTWNPSLPQFACDAPEIWKPLVNPTYCQ